MLVSFILLLKTKVCLVSDSILNALLIIRCMFGVAILLLWMSDEWQIDLLIWLYRNDFYFIPACILEQYACYMVLLYQHDLNWYLLECFCYQNSYIIHIFFSNSVTEQTISTCITKYLFSVTDLWIIKHDTSKPVLMVTGTVFFYNQLTS